MSAVSPTAPPSGAPHHGPLRVLAAVAASLVAVVGLALVLAGAALAILHATQRDADGYYTSDVRRITTPTAALVGPDVDLGEGSAGRAIADVLDARVRLRAVAADGGPLFVGVARTADVDRWLDGVAYDQVRDVDDGRVVLRRHAGQAIAGPPGAQDIWVASAAGSGPQTVTWKARDGRWSAVVLRRDGRPPVSADVSVGADTDALLPIGLGALGLGLVLLAAGGAGVWGALRRFPPGTDAGAAPVAAAPVAVAAADAEAPAPYPVTVEARIDAPLSRWLWLVKWLLALPHWIVLAFLWIAFLMVSVVALVAVVATARYPRGLFAFNLGVLRWTWRVWAYAHVLSTDRYPPFSLGPEPDYPATLEVPYPERLSRGIALVQWWLLVLPHAVVLAALFGGVALPWGEARSPGVVTVLAVIAGVVLLFRGRYPRDIFTLLLGLHRWLLRVIAYAALLRQDYPPFRLDR